MLNIDEMSAKEIRELLHKVGYGHLSFIYEGKPSVIPMHYYLEGADIYLFTTEGMKTYGMDVNPEICLQVEEVTGSLHWRSVVVKGRAERITDRSEIVGVASRNENRIMQLIKAQNPSLTPAINRNWIDTWGRADVSRIYRISHYQTSGRMTNGVSSNKEINPPHLM
ncbi:pyridoxamine 5'-phosphate oxidase family protein [Chamaesiphon minutus]|uniref:Putative flavin-nucleotide-binding protein n=1 Tax=Chamaesiphon minutus (strain ATCC 27169 / PCC 6605) TaxID=1173020 RepID=K9UQK0_CHAP6|nr:pyridoxamine 5'-phosphate oxidase family protein [Chamaesiphon minutus]AFY96514.1 putative flavin-nucleotide-binding protein [Chamaesiphon minutus PCC 6605]